MSLKSIIRDLWIIRDEMRKKPKAGGAAEERKQMRRRRRTKAYIAPEQPFSLPSSTVPQSQWADMPPELLHDIIQRVEQAEISWPARRDVVACASVCRSWREITNEIVKTPEQCGLLTFPISLKQPGPRDSLIQCFIQRERETSTYRLFLGLSPALSGDMSKLLLTARKIRRATSTEFVISLAADDFSRASTTYVGKLRSNFLGSKFTIYDSQPPHGSPIQTNHKSHKKMNSKHAISRIPAGSYNVATVSYELNILRTRGPRRMQCIMQSIPISAVQEGGVAPTPTDLKDCLNQQTSLSPVSQGKKLLDNLSCGSPRLDLEYDDMSDPLILKNKAPRWHEQLQCWCLNFRGRVTVASVKNFQLVAAAEPSQNVSEAEQEKVILQFGKIGKDIFTMDYRYPLSTFQAFAICLSCFDTKPACE
ncbi:tubby-like F-box protein 5 [Rosa rugosa]|uniref:tubby-like F-box protein 5 n=1 Tax=Rosa rugosa TaxID=74645 RepID=UPI002B4174DE|nr:tubby-like F-box protein 5 [Rosa rugosa]